MRCKGWINSIFLIIGRSTIVETVIQIRIFHGRLWGKSKRNPSGITRRNQTDINNIWWKTPCDHSTLVIARLNMLLGIRYFRTKFSINQVKMYLTSIYISHARNCITTLAVVEAILIKIPSWFRQVQKNNFESVIKILNKNLPFVLTPGWKIPYVDSARFVILLVP